jgi:diguanylate cyclase (GGDEF)-like protein
MYLKSKFKNNHFIVILLVSFVLILIILFAYLKEIDKTIKKYSNYRQIVLETYAYTQDLDRMFLYAYRHIDNEQISTISKIIEKNLALLEERRLFYHSRDISNLLKIIRQKYQLKSEYLEDFKTLNSQMSNLEHLLAKNTHLGLGKSILDMDRFLKLEEQKNKDTEDMISLIFFICAFFLLLGLIHSYLKIFSNQKEMYYLAYHDALTMLPNRLQFEEYILALIQNKKQNFILLFIDLDRFKVINDTLGHDIGDEILITISKRLKKTLGKKSFVARLGGDEFIAIIHYNNRFKEIEIILDTLIEEVRKPLIIKEYNLNITSSIGVVKYPQDAQDKNTLLKYADSAMYHAKDIGKDTYAFYNTQLSVDMHRRLELEQALTTALKKEEFSLMFQPQYDLNSQEMIAVEALVRWESPLLGSVSPDEFISVAEDIGLIIKLGYHIFREACLAYMHWKKQGLILNLIAINISSMQFRQLDAFDNFKKIIKETGIDPHHIEIELTERYIMEYSSNKLSILDELRSIGCQISIDDFGTGYSSMSYLKRLSIDTIKIDKSFVDDLANNKHDAEVSKAIILLSQTLGYKVIAEGIETKEQEDILRNYGCDMGQGYYFSKPIEREELIPFYHQKQKEKSRRK